MKKYILFFTAVLSLLTFGGIYPSKTQTKTLANEKWSGTISLLEKFTGITGTSERRVEASFTEALPTLHRNDPTTNLSFTDDKGTGTAKYHAEFIIEGKRLGTTDCFGIGQTELHEVVVDKETNTYRIHAIGPPCTGSSVSALDGSTEPYGPEVTDIIVSEQPRGKDPNVLSGTDTVVSDIGVGKITRTTTWNLIRGPIEVELIVTPVNYDIWMPKPGRDELSKGSVMDISLKVQGKNGRPATIKAVRFELRLSNTSREPGITINFPLRPSSKQLPDLRFLPDRIGESVDEDQSISINSADGKTGEVTIASYDGGGWSTLTAEAVLEGGIRIKGKLLASNGIEEIPIPKRDPGKKIATAWLTANGNPGEMDDKETTPVQKSAGNKNKGDGLTAYEEYRGVISLDSGNPAKEEFRRLDPQKQELGVRVKRSEFPQFSEGISWFENASGLTVIRFDETQILETRELNKNASSAHDYNQFVLKLEKGETTKGAAGENRPTTLNHMIPEQSELVVINIDWINQFYALQEDAAKDDGVPMPYTKTELVSSTVAHELAHGVDVNHHGDPTVMPQNRTAYEDSQPVYHIFDNNGIEIQVQRWKFDQGLNKRYYEIIGTAGQKGNEASGDLSCMMTYTSMYNWAFRTGSDGSLIYYMVKILPVGKKFCNSKIGTGINTEPNSNYFGNATTGGNCLSQIKLRP